MIPTRWVPFARPRGSISRAHYQLFKEVLGAESLMLGFCHPDCNAHGPNEFFALEDFHCGIKTAAHFLDQLAKAL